MQMTTDEFEFAISQYIDGTLPPDQRDALDERFAGDREARALLAEYRSLDASLRGGLPLPEIDWNAFETSLSGVLDEAEAPYSSMRIFGFTTGRRLALAASVLLAVSLSVLLVNRRGGSNPAAVSPLARAPQGVAIVSGPSIAHATGPVIADVSIGPSPAFANSWRAGQEVVSRPTVVLIDRAELPAQDGANGVIDSPIY